MAFIHILQSTDICTAAREAQNRPELKMRKSTPIEVRQSCGAGGRAGRRAGHRATHIPIQRLRKSSTRNATSLRFIIGCGHSRRSYDRICPAGHVWREETYPFRRGLPGGRVDPKACEKWHWLRSAICPGSVARVWAGCPGSRLCPGWEVPPKSSGPQMCFPK